MRKSYAFSARSISDFKEIKSIVSSTAIYLGTGLVQRAGGILLVPFLVATVSPEDFTRYGLFASLLVLAPHIVSVNVHSAATRLVFDYDAVVDQSALLRTVWIASTVIAIFVLSVVGIAHLTVGIPDPVTVGKVWIYWTVSLAIVSTISIQFALAVARVYRKAAVFSALSIAKTVGVIGMYLAAAFLIGGSYEVIIVTFGLSLFAVASLSLRFTFPMMKGGRYSGKMLRAALRFSWPTVINLAAIWTISMSGRWIGSLYISLGDLAGYILLTFIVGGAGTIGRALFDARLPDIGEAFASESYPRGRSIVATTAFCAAGLVVLAYVAAFAALSWLGHLLPQQYVPSNSLLAIGLLANLLDCVYLYGFQSLVAMKKTEIQAASTTISAIFVVGLSFFLAPNFGESGLIAATAFGFFLQACITLAVASNRYRSLLTNGMSK